MPAIGAELIARRTAAISSNSESDAAGRGQVPHLARWTAAAGCLGALGYGGLKTIWALGGTIGIDDPAELRPPGTSDSLWLVENLATAALAAVAALILIAVIWPVRAAMPRRIVRAFAWLGTVMILPGGVGLAEILDYLAGSHLFAEPNLGGVSAAAYLFVYTCFLTLGVSFATTTFLSRRRRHQIGGDGEVAGLPAQALDVLRIIGLLPGSIARMGRTYTPPIGTPNGIAEYKPVVINGHPQQLLIRGQDVSKPLLLYVPGGPGESNIWAAHRTMRALEAHFVCVNWDPRGAAGSLRPAPPPETMTTSQILSDTIALVELLLRRFGQRKVLLLGHSWGSTIAMKVAAARPDLLYAVIGMGQEADRERGEAISYEYVLQRARADRNRKAVRELEELGGSDTFGKSGKFVQRLWLMHYGGIVHSGGILQTMRVLLEAPEYSIVDCIRYARMDGTKFCIPLMSDELIHMNLLSEIRALAVPVFLFEGRYDQTAPAVLAEEFYRALRAPRKRLIWFEHSGHPPDFEEPQKFQRELIAIGKEFCREEVLA